MEQFRNAAIPLLAALLCAGSGYAWLVRRSEGGLDPGAIGASTGPAAQQREALAIAPKRAQTPRKTPPALPQVAVVFQGGLLTVRARGAPLAEVLTAITRSVGVTFDFRGNADERLSIDLGPRPAQEVISILLDRTSYGYAFVDAARGAKHARPAEVFLVKQGTAGDVSRRPAARALAALVTSEPAAAVEPSSPPDEAALQQQRAVDALFDACKVQGCDTS